MLKTSVFRKRWGLLQKNQVSVPDTFVFMDRPGTKKPAACKWLPVFRNKLIRFKTTGFRGVPARAQCFQTRL